MTDFALIFDWIDQQQDRMVETLTHWSNLNTGTYNAAGLLVFARQLKPILQQLSPTITEIPLPPYDIINELGQPESRPLGTALSLHSPDQKSKIENQKTPPLRVLLNIHMDTVFPPSHPFQTATRTGNTLRGPGVCDAKGGLLILIYSLLALQHSPLAKQIQWEILLNPDEEIGSPGSAPLFLEAAKRNDLALLFEPALSDGALAASHKGSGTFTIVAHGKTAHSGRDPHLGRNAIHALAHLITQLTPLEQEIPGLVVNTGLIHGGTAPNVVPDLALARINIRVETPEQQQRFESRLTEILANIQIENRKLKIENPVTFDLHGKFSFPPKPLTPPIEKLLHHFRDCAAQLGMPPLTWRPVGGACDGNRLAAAGLPNVDNLGPIGGSMHTDQEFIHIDSLAQRTKLTTLFLLRLAAGDLQLPTR